MHTAGPPPSAMEHGIVQHIKYLQNKTWAEGTHTCTHSCLTQATCAYQQTHYLILTKFLP